MNNLYNLIKYLIYIIIFCFFFTTAIAKSSDWAVSEASKLRIISAYSQNDSKVLLLGLEYKMEPGWKTYWKSPGDGGFAQSISWDNSSNIKNINVLWPTPVEFEILGLKSLGYQNDVIFPMQVEVEDVTKDINLDLHVSYLICKDICIPGDARLFLKIPSGEKKSNDEYFNLERALSHLPEKNSNSSYIKQVEVNVFKNNQFSTIQIKIESDKSFYNPKIFLHTPFGLPVVKKFINYSSDNKLIIAEFNYDNNLISNKKFPLEVIIQDKNHNFEKKLNVQMDEDLLNKKFKSTHIYYILISLLAGLILNVMPCVFPILSIKLMSVFDVDQNNIRVSFITTAFGIITSFALLGLIFILLQYFNFTVAWGMQFQQPIFLLFITLIIFLFMMNMFGQFEINLPNTLSNFNFFGNSQNKLLRDFFNGFFATLMATPCSAPFVGTAITAAFTQTQTIAISIFLFMGIGMSLPYLLIASFPKSINFIPKPGKWMIYIKYFLGLLLLITVLWLSNILLNFFNFYALIIFLFLFLILSYRKKIPFIKNTVTIGLLIVIFFSSSLNIFQQNPIIKNDKDWLNYFEVDINKFLIKDQLVFLDITADWCATCQFNKLNVLNSENVVKLFQDNNVVLIRADWTRPNKKINLFLEKYDRFGIPFNAFFSYNFPDGILLSELLSEKEMVNTITKINNE